MKNSLFLQLKIFNASFWIFGPPYLIHYFEFWNFDLRFKFSDSKVLEEHRHYNFIISLLSKPFCSRAFFNQNSSRISWNWKLISSSISQWSHCDSPYPSADYNNPHLASWLKRRESVRNRRHLWKHFESVLRFSQQSRQNQFLSNKLFPSSLCLHACKEAR